MKYLVMLMLGYSLAYGATHEYMVALDAPANPTNKFSSLTIVSWRQLGSSPMYHLTIDSSLSAGDVKQTLINHQGVLSAEIEQTGKVAGLEAVGSVNSRLLGTMDEVIEETDLVYAGGISSRVIIVIDESQTEFAPIFQQYHVGMVRADMAWDYTRGTGQTVAVIDTGVDSLHPFLEARMVAGYDFVDDDALPDEVMSQLDTNHNGYIDEGFGHGTHVAGIVHTIAPGASIMPIRVADSDGQAELSHIIAGVLFAVDNGADVINLSMSISEPSPMLAQALDMAQAAGVVVVTSAGNEGSTNLMYPAKEPEVLTVAAVDINGKKTDYSNYGRLVDVAAPGHRVVSAYPGGSYVSRSGTSMAAPIISAEAAIVFELVPDGSVQYVRHRITNKVRDIRYLNPGTKIGGLADVWDAITVQNQN